MKKTLEQNELLIYIYIVCAIIFIYFLIIMPPFIFGTSAETPQLEFLLNVANMVRSFLGIITLFIFYMYIRLFFKTSTSDDKSDIPKNIFFSTIFLMIIAGTMIRLIPARIFYGNYDMRSYDIVSDIVLKGGNVYAETQRYNYSPVWFTLLGIMKKMHLRFTFLHFPFIVKSFLCCVDMLTLFFLMLISRHEKISLVKTTLFFYLNPVSFLLTGFHGQFENLALLMIIIGIYLYLRFKDNPITGKILLWVFATLGMIVKHNVFYELIICLNYALKRNRVKIFLFLISVTSFLLLFLPFWNKGSRGIISNVFGYPSDVGSYGITSLFNFAPLRYIFILSLCVFPFFIKSQDIIKQCLVGTVFFLAFTTGIAIQYFTLPIALGALRPSRGFLVYSLFASLHILGSPNNIFLPVFKLSSFNVVWIGVIYWFFTDMVSLFKVRYERL